MHDFPDPYLGKAVPYGVYDVAAITGGSPWASTTTPAVRGGGDPPVVGDRRPGRYPDEDGC